MKSGDRLNYTGIKVSMLQSDLAKKLSVLVSFFCCLILKKTIYRIFLKILSAIGC